MDKVAANVGVSGLRHVCGYAPRSACCLPILDDKELCVTTQGVVVDRVEEDAAEMQLCMA